MPAPGGENYSPRWREPGAAKRTQGKRVPRKAGQKHSDGGLGSLRLGYDPRPHVQDLEALRRRNNPRILSAIPYNDDPEKEEKVKEVVRLIHELVERLP